MTFSYVDTIIDVTTGVRTDVLNRGDGTGTRTVYDSEGDVVSTEELTDCPLPPPIDSARALAYSLIEKYPSLSSAIDALPEPDPVKLPFEIVKEAVADGVAAEEANNLTNEVEEGETE